MPFNSDGSYTAASGATTAFSGETIASATWNAIFTDIQNCLRASPYILLSKTGINFNSASTDTAFTINLPTGFTRFIFISATISHASHDISTATFQVRTASAGGGSGLVGTTSITVTATADVTVNNAQTTTGALFTVIASALATPNTIYFRIINAEGVAATADVQLIIQIVP